jgi:hypothetical protein
MTPAHDAPLEGGCDCRHVRYRMESAPLFVHCCHCRWCQRETGASFALNALIETDRVRVLEGQVEAVETPSNSGKGQTIMRCPTCKVALWSHYNAAGNLLSFVRVGTLDDPDRLPPRPLPDDVAAVVRPLLPLPLVPARDGGLVRVERPDRVRSGAAAVRRRGHR